MTVEVPPAGVDPDADTAISSGPGVGPGRIRRGLAMVIDGVVISRVKDGRLRDVGWPAGWQALVGVGYVAFAVAAGLALTAGLWRRTGLVVVTDLNGIPASAIWLLTLLVTVVAALFHTAAVHATWWARGLSMVMMTVLMVVWMATSVGGGAVSDTWWLAAPSVLSIVTLNVVTLRWMRSAPRWWEFGWFLGLIATPVALAMVSARLHQIPLGYDLVPALLAQMIGAVSLLALPAAFASGTAVAEITVSATVWAATAATRLGRRRTLLIALGVVCLLRVAQCVHDVGGTDRLDWTWWAWAPVAGALLVLAVLSWVLVRWAGVPPQVTELPERLSAFGLPLGAALLGVLVPFTLMLYAIQIAITLAHVGSLDAVSPLLTGDALTAMLRGVVLVVLVVLAFRLARRRAAAPALLAGHIAVFLLPAPLALTGVTVPLLPDPDRLNLVATAGAFVLVAVQLVRRRLTANRIAVLGALVVLGGVFSARETLLDPLTALLGPIAPVILLGLVWTLIAGCAWANTDGGRFSAPVRSLLAVGNIVLATVVLAYGALAGHASQGGLDTAADLGDSVLGTALLTSTVVVLLVQLRSGRALT